MSEVPPSKDMAEQAHHHTAEDKEGEPQSTNMDHVSECKQEEADIALNEKQQLSEDSASSSASTSNNNGEDLEQPDVKTEERMVQGGSSPLDEDATSLQANEESRGDYNQETPRNEQPIMTAEEISRESGECHTGEKKTSEATTPPTLGGRKDDQGDGPRSRPNEETPDINSTDTEAGEEIGEKKAPETTTPPTLGDRKDDQVDGPDHEETPDTDNTDTDTEAGDGDGSGPKTALAPEEDTTSQQTEEETHKQRQHIETIGPTPQDDAPVPAVAGHFGGLRIYVIASVLLVAVAILVQQLLQPEPPPQRDDVRQIDIFLKQLEKVKTQFPNQRVELWNRSKIHLLRHLQTAQPTEPVSLILTAGHRAERTLHCLAQSLASAFSSALNASVLHIDGAGKASQDSDQVKLDIDSKLQGAFEGDKPVAVINRFEELPPGSTLIFYRYCDHENAAYKKTCLIFTVLLGEEEEIPAETRLSMVEEMVDDHLQKKFISDGHPVSFDRMDLDKYGGLWSRISHLILPVAAEGRIEHDGC